MIKPVKTFDIYYPKPKKNIIINRNDLMHEIR